MGQGRKISSVGSFLLTPRLMRIHHYPGIFIDIEGIDGSGASTQVELVSSALKKKGIDISVTKEPTNCPTGKLIRQVLQRQLVNLSPSTLELLFAADRGLHFDQVILPSLEKGETIISDRYVWSSVAYGSVYLGKEWLLCLNNNFIFPDLTFFIDVEPEVCMDRLKKEKESFELFDDEESLTQAWDAYHWLATKYWWAPIVSIDGEEKPEIVTEKIVSRILLHPKIKKLLG